MNYEAKSQRIKITLDRSNTDFGVKLFEHLKQLTYDLAKNPEQSKKWSFLRYYQNIIREYFNTISLKSRGLLVFLPPGMGKTIAAVAVAIDQMNERFPIILASKSLHENFYVGIKKYIEMRTKSEPNFYLGKIPPSDIDKWIERNFGFVSMNASNMIEQLIKESEGQVGKEFRKVQTKVERKRVKEGQYKSAVAVGSLDDKILIVDEAHNLFRAITNGSKNGIELYNMVMKAKNLKLLFLTGTMPVNDPFEFVPCFNMLAETENGVTLFPESYHDFRRMFISERKVGLMSAENPEESMTKLKMINKDKFQNRIYGLVSRVGFNTMLGKGIIDSAEKRGEKIDFAQIGLTGESQPVNFPKVLPLETKYLPMSKSQYALYLIARNKEQEEYKVKRVRRGAPPIMQKPKSGSASTYRQKSRQMSNFAPPAELGIIKFSEIDMDKISDSDVESAKLDALYKELMARPGIGYVYSQFVGAGGLGSIMRYLEKKGWKIFGEQKRITTGKPPKKTQTKITTGIPSDFADAIVENIDVKNDNDGEIEGNEVEGTEGGKSTRLSDFNEYMSKMEKMDAFIGGNNNLRNSTLRLLFVVNGQTDFCAESRQIGNSDVGLNAKGKEQAEILAKKLASTMRKKNILFSNVIVSPSKRSKNVFDILVNSLDKKLYSHVLEMEDLLPINGGILDGMKKDTVTEILNEVGRSSDEGLKGLSLEFIIDTLENIKEMRKVKNFSEEMMRDITDVLNMDKSKIAKILSKEETHEEYIGRVSVSAHKILSNARSMINEVSDITEGSDNVSSSILIISPNSVSSELRGLIKNIIRGKTEKTPNEISPTIIKKIKIKKQDVNALKSLQPDKKACGITGGSKSSLKSILDKMINEVEEKRYGNGSNVHSCSDHHGGKETQDKKADKHDKFAYFSGEVDVEDREKIRMTFNSKENSLDGKNIRTLLLSATGAEGLDLENARYGIAYEPYWVWPRLEQVFARGVRHNSHINLPKEDQNFQPVLFIAVKPGTENVDYADYVKRVVSGISQPGDGDLLTTDLELYIESLITNDLNKQFAEAVYEVSIECVLNGENNCRMCSPTDSKLFGFDIEADMRQPNLCEKYIEETIEAMEIIVDGVVYYYTPNPKSVFGYKIYEYDDSLGNYKEMDMSNSLYSEIADAIADAKK